MEFLKSAKDYARNPLGIIALFISLIYGFASLLLNFAVEKLTVCERWPLIIFIVVFPIMVLVTFYKLVTNHHGKLYAPGDYKDDKSFLRTLSAEEQKEKLDKEVNESLGEIAEPLTPIKHEVTSRPITSVAPEEQEERIRTHREFREELKEIEEKVITDIASELKVVAERNIGIGGLDVTFDALLNVVSDKFTFIEVKVLKSPHSALMLMDRLLYHSVLADRFFNSKFKLILVIVYYFEESELNRVESQIRKKISNCPAEIELKLLPITKVKKT